MKLFCAVLLGGHDDILKPEGDRLRVECLRCGRVSEGVAVGRARDDSRVSTLPRESAGLGATRPRRLPALSGVHAR